MTTSPSPPISRPHMYYFHSAQWNAEGLDTKRSNFKQKKNTNKKAKSHGPELKSHCLPFFLLSYRNLLSGTLAVTNVYWQFLPPSVMCINVNAYSDRFCSLCCALFYIHRHHTLFPYHCHY